MSYYLDLFSPETAKAFSESNKDISGFRVSKKTYIDNKGIGPGDRFICYCTRIQRFIGILEIKSKYFIDEKPIFLEENDPFVLRFKVEPIVWLPLEKSIPIHEDFIWNNLSFTKELDKKSSKWTHWVFGSPVAWPEKDCKFLEEELLKQNKNQLEYPFTEEDKKKLRTKTTKIRIGDKKQVTINVPDDSEEEEELDECTSDNGERESIKIQAKLAEIGEDLGFKIWLPANDRSKVLGIWNPKEDSLLEELPLVFDEVTLKTIRNIDVLWIKRRSIVRAFEIEDSTSIYSGILRMADLLALQPMLDIKIHIVAPTHRREKVFTQINRPVFAMMGEDPLSKSCTFISYDSVNELKKVQLLKHMNDSIIEEYSESTGEDY